DDAARMALTRAINHAHAAATDLFEDLVIAEPPVLVRQINLGENVGEAFGFALVGRIESRFEQATAAKPPGDMRRGIAMRTRLRIGDSPRDGMRGPRAET